MRDTSFAIDQLVFNTPTDPYDVFLELNRCHLWDISVWENKTVHFKASDFTDYDWDIRLDDPGVSTSLQGDSTEALANGICVTFFNLSTGASERLIPDNYPELVDYSEANPANLHGLKVWTELQISSPVTKEAALQIGRAALAEFTQAKSPGTITTGPTVRDRYGNLQPAWKVRAGDRVAITSSTSLSDRPRMITEASYSQNANGSGSASLSIDSTRRTLEAVLDRIGTSLNAANLT